MTNPRYNEFKDCYLEESTFGTSAIGQATNAYLFGVLTGKQGWPAAVTTPQYGGVPVGRQEPSALFKSPYDSIGSLLIGMQNAIPLWMMMGKSATTGPVSEIYTHTIGPLSTDSGAIGSNPSFTIHHEAHGTDVTSKAMQFLGCKVFNLQLGISQFESASSAPVLLAKMDWIARQQQTMAWVLDNDPALPVTANTDEYKWANMTVTWDKGGVGEAELDGLAQLQLQIMFMISPVKTHWYSGGTYMGRWPYKYREGAKKTYHVELSFLPENYDLLAELLDESTLKDLEIKFVRTADEDEITITLTDCSVFKHELTTPKPEEALEEAALVVGRAFSATAKDKLAGGPYGE